MAPDDKVEPMPSVVRREVGSFAGKGATCEQGPRFTPNSSVSLHLLGVVFKLVCLPRSLEWCIVVARLPVA